MSWFERDRFVQSTIVIQSKGEIVVMRIAKLCKYVMLNVNLLKIVTVNIQILFYSGTHSQIRNVYF